MADTQSTIVVLEVTPEQAARTAARFWWVLLVAGLLSLAFGIWIVFEPVHAAHTVAVLLGLWLLVVGIVDLVHAGSARHRGSAVLSGIILIALGIVLVFKPNLPVKVVAILFGIAILIGGIVRIVSAIADRSYGWGWRLVLGLISTTLGIVIVIWPTATVGVVFWIAGICAMLTGIAWIVASFGLRRAPERVAAGDTVAPF
jgi:uncharacterized membrane protein HdeD (DUF308 family)